MRIILGGQSAASYALLSGATFSGAVSAASFSGDGAGLTNVSADSLDGNSGGGFCTAFRRYVHWKCECRPPKFAGYKYQNHSTLKPRRKTDYWRGAYRKLPPPKSGCSILETTPYPRTIWFALLRKDPAGDDAFGRGKFKLQTADGGRSIRSFCC